MRRAKRVIVNGSYSIRNKGSKRVPHVYDNTEEIEYKYCSKCATLKNLGEFHDNIRTWDNKTSFCKECTGDIMKKNYDRRKWLKANPGMEYPEIIEEITTQRYDLETISQAAQVQLGTTDFSLIDYVQDLEEEM